MTFRLFSVISVLSACTLMHCTSPSSQYGDDPVYLHRAVKQLTDVIIHDIFSPPVASRIYAYPSIAAYEIAAAAGDSFPSLAGRLNGLTPVPPAPDEGMWDPTLAAVHAFLTVGRELIFSEGTIEAFQLELYNEMRNRGMMRSVYHASLHYGDQVAEHILAWAADDNYKQTRTYPKYSITTEPTRWQPTPPAYMEGIEPHWNLIRPFAMDSASQFLPAEPTAFSTDPDSRFYAEAMEVLAATEPSLAEFDERVAIAAFWDCNPYVMHQRGHVMFATKKITPGGHWMGIAGQACRQAGLSMAATARVYAFVAISLADGFIACWDEKYRSNLVRPETFINTHIDPDWRPVLQTPPFPEHTSGHSVISSAAGEVLTALFGDNFAYTDSVELDYGLPVRSFSSFREAYQEAAMSRLYGGIHYMPAISDGIEQGQKLGRFLVEKLIVEPVKADE